MTPTSIDEDDFDSIRHLLPESVLSIITVIGLTETLELVRNLKGTTYPLREGRTRNSEARLAYLEEIIGGQALEKLVIAMAPCDLFIPRCERAIMELRDRMIRRQFEEQLAAGAPAYEAANDLALAYNMTDRQIWRIVKKIDRDTVRQDGLF